MIYLHLFIGMNQSLSVKILIDLFSSKNKTLTLKKLMETGLDERMIYERLNIMEKNKWIKVSNGHYSCLKKSIIIVKINLFFKKLYKFTETG